MGASKAHINPTCWAIAGTYQGLKYDGINVTPHLAEGKISFSITTDKGELKPFEEVPFPAPDQNPQRYEQIVKQVIGHKLQVLL